MIPDVALAHNFFALLALIPPVFTILVVLIINKLLIGHLYRAIFEATREAQLIVINVSNFDIA